MIGVKVMQRAYYESSLQDFLQQDENLILGILARNNEYTLEDLQRNAWLAEIRILKSQLAVLKTGHIIFEYTIPRIGERIDVVYLKENTVELLDKCHYVSGLEEDVKNAVDGCKIINEEHMGRSYAVTVMQDGDGKIKAVQHVTVQPVSLQNLFIAICGQSNM